MPTKILARVLACRCAFFSPKQTEACEHVLTPVPRPLPLKLPLSQPPELVLEAYPSGGLMSAVVRELDVVLGEGLLLVLRHDAIAV